MAIERYDLVNVLREDETPWRVISHKVQLPTAQAKLKEIDPWEYRIDVDPAGDDWYSVLTLAQDSTKAIVVPSMRVKEPAASAWFLSGPAKVD